MALSIQLSDDRHGGDAQTLREGGHHVDDRLGERDGARDQRSRNIVDEKTIHQGHHGLHHAQHEAGDGKEENRARNGSVQYEIAALGCGLVEKLEMHRCVMIARMNALLLGGEATHIAKLSLSEFARPEHPSRYRPVVPVMLDQFREVDLHGTKIPQSI